MGYEIIAAIIGIALLGIFMVYFLIYHKYMVTHQQTKESEQHQMAVDRTLDRFFEAKEKKATIEKLAQIERLKLDMESKIQQKATERKDRAKIQLANKPDESQVIEEGGKIFLSFSEGLKTALPTNEAEKQQDMSDLMAAVQALEKMDQSHYRVQEDRSLDMGKGMLYDSISRKLERIIKKKNYKEMEFIQAEKLEIEAFEIVKRLEHEDYLETLRVMKEIRSIRDLIELNPQTHLIVFRKTPIKLTQAEKVVFSFAADSDILTTARLQDQTQWKPAYMNKVLKSLETKGFLEIKDENLVIKGLITAEERNERAEKLKEIEKHKEEFLKKEARLSKEIEEKEQALKREQEKQREEELKKQQETILEEARIKAEKEAKELRANAEKIAEQEELERFEKIKALPKPKIKTLPLPTTTGTRPSLKPISPQPLPSSQEASQTKVIKDPMAIKMAEEAKLLAKAMPSGQKEKLLDGVPDLAVPEEDEFGELPELPLPDGDDFGELPELSLPDGDDFGELPELNIPIDEGFSDMEDLEKFKKLAQKMEKQNVQEEEENIDDLEDFFSDLGDEAIPDEESENQEYIDAVVNILNEVGQFTYGIVTFKFLLKNLQAQFPSIEKITVSEVIDDLKIQNIILDELSFSGTQIYIFEQMELDDDMQKLLRQFVINGIMDEEDISLATEWNEDKVKYILEKLSKIKILKQNEQNQYYIPGFFNSDQ